MPNDLTNPLQFLLSRAAEQLPAKTGETGRYRARLDGAGVATVICCDVSGSMSDIAGNRRKIEILREALQAAVRPGDVLVAFESTARVISGPNEIPEPGGGTAMDAGLDLAATFGPARTLIISDGQPNDNEAALRAAERLLGIIDVLYVGPDSDAAAVAFMRSLARTGCGRVVIHDVIRWAADRPALTRQIAGLLGGPAR